MFFDGPAGPGFGAARVCCLERYGNLPLISLEMITTDFAMLQAILPSSTTKVFVDVHPYQNYSGRTFIAGQGLWLSLLFQLLGKRWARDIVC
jgi:hypothetical protein